MTDRYLMIEDPGHGWLRVPRAELEDLGIAGDISGYSYVAGPDVWLEEDCDLARYLTARARRDGYVEEGVQRWAHRFLTHDVTYEHDNGDSFIRRLPRYAA